MSKWTQQKPHDKNLSYIDFEVRRKPLEQREQWFQILALQLKLDISPL